MKLTRKTFTTKDDNGCEFRVCATYSKDWQNVDGTLVMATEAHYKALSVQSDSLKELKTKVSLL